MTRKKQKRRKGSKMQFLSLIYLVYMFIILYFFFFFLILFVRNRKIMFDLPPRRNYSISVLTPALNEEESIEGTVEAVLASDYPVKEMIVIDNGSTDKTIEILKRLMKKHKNLRYISESRKGKAAALNAGLKIATGELIAVIDSDSYPEKDAIGKMTGFFRDTRVGAVTCAILVKHKNKFIEKLQAMEYSIIAWTRKLLGYIDGIWATPGPLSLYRAEILKKIGFDPENLTEDIEVTWNILSKNYKVEMCLPARVYSIAPQKVMIWAKQRIRWSVGGMQCIGKYKSLFLRRGMLGLFIIPFFIISMFIGLLGMAVFGYITIRSLILTFLFTQYSFGAGTSLITSEDVYISGNVLNYFGIVIFILGFWFTILGLSMMKEARFKGARNIFNLFFYIIVYLALYPLILIFAIGKMIKYKIQGRKLGWGTK